MMTGVPQRICLEETSCDGRIASSAVGLTSLLTPIDCAPTISGRVIGDATKRGVNVRMAQGKIRVRVGVSIRAMARARGRGQVGSSMRGGPQGRNNGSLLQSCLYPG